VKKPSPQATGGILIILMGLYVFLHVAPMAEIFLRVLSVNLRPTIITGLLLGFGVLFSGHLGRFWQLRIGKVWFVLLILYSLAAVLGEYRGQSVPFIAEYGIRFHTIPFLICATAFTTRDVHRLMYWAGGSAFVLLALCLTVGRLDEGGRFFIPKTSLSNPNDLALLLLLGATYLLLMAYSSSTFPRLIALVALPMVLYFVLQTGSRANFLTVLAVIAVLMFTVPQRVKLAIGLLLPVLAVGMALLVPTSTWQRLTMIVLHPEEEIYRNPDASHEVGSQLARQLLLERAIALTARHPLFGVGPQMFEVGVEEMVRSEEKVKSGWQAAHNVYLQIAAENGVPGFILFVWFVFWCLKTNFRTFRQTRTNPEMVSCRNVSLCLLLLGVTYSFGILFSNTLYDPALPILLGLTAANRIAFDRENPAPALQPAQRAA